MPLPPGMARAFETAGKQGCDCVAWSRKRRTGFISRQGGYESPRPPSLVPRRTTGQNVPNHFDKQAYLSTFTLFERTTTTISVDNTGKDLSTVFAPYHVNHNFIRPSIFGLYLIQRASGFFLKQFKTAICHKLLDVFDTRQIIFRCVKFLPFLNIMTVVTHCNSLHNQIFLNFEMGGKPF